MTKELIGERLCKIRDYRDRTQAELGEAIGLDKTAISRIENGTRELSYNEAAACAQVLCFCLNAFYRTEADGQWNISACLLPYAPPTAGLD